jgi:deoxyribodipyrimidine photo-lyase
VAGDPTTQLPAIAEQLQTLTIFCETISAPEEMAQVAALRQQGYQLTSIWQSSLLAPEQLPFDCAHLPLVFTQFRQIVEQAGITPAPPLPSPRHLPPPPTGIHDLPCVDLSRWLSDSAVDARSAFPYTHPNWQGGERPALAHLSRYFTSERADHYKTTRNGLIGSDYSTKFSPWLASGALSVRQIYQQLKAYEAQHGTNDGSYWIWFELLWRDYFRFLSLRFGRQLYRASGLKGHAQPEHHPARFWQWCQGQTGQRFIDAGMRELAVTGYLSNRMRQNVASYLIHQLHCDWRAGAAWFEAQLLDYDVHSNQGNWLYLAGLGTDPRPQRRFNLNIQMQNYDPEQTYQQLWN